MKKNELTQRIRKGLFTVAIGLWCASPALADGDRVQELESRVAELEAMVQQLLQSQGADSQARAAAQQAQADAAAARAQVEELSQRAEPAIVAAEKKSDSPEFYYGGYIKSDFMVSNFDDGEVDGSSLGRDFFVPAIVPIGGDSQTVFDAHARQTRFHLGTRHSIGDNSLESYIEMDFLTTAGGTERTTNNFSPRLRHAYLKWNNWLIGQTWNTFMDVGALPESADFIGPTSGVIFGRSPQIRYSSGNFAIALENPESSITLPSGARSETDDNKLPELAARYQWKGDWGYVQLGGMLRQLEIDDNATGLDDTEIGWGASLSGRFNIGRDDLKWMVHYGDGMGRHLALNFVNGGVITDRGQIEAISTIGGYVAYRHWWNEQWRSSVTLGYIEADNPVRFTGLGANESSVNGQVNLFYSPVKPLSFGIEYLYAEREIESGATGQLNRFQFTTKYAF
ncbi:MAG: DcaP family trimeric outer membrane transporter [Wenzhouxiangellaceae bacterium]|nr:DcaP family trimeric outer membrane transporter [Wenzhouxiangellaceae bacterium]